MSKIIVVVLAIVVVKVIVDYLVASYGRDEGFPFVAVFVSSFFLGFPLVLLAVAVAGGPRHGARR